MNRRRIFAVVGLWVLGVAGWYDPHPDLGRNVLGEPYGYVVFVELADRFVEYDVLGLDGQAFMRTAESGEARVTDSASNGVGKLVTGSLERSNVDIASEFTKLIVAQRAYTANTRVVTTSDEMLQETLNMRR